MMYHLLIPVIAVALVLPALPRRRDDNWSRKQQAHDRPLQSRLGILCNIWTVLSSAVVLIVWATCDLHFNGSEVLLSTASDDSWSEITAADDAVDVDGQDCGAGNCSASFETLRPGTADNATWGDDDRQDRPSLDEVSDAISLHCSMASLILGAAMVLELLQVIAHRTVARRDQENDEEDGGDRRRRQRNHPHERDDSNNTIYTLFGWHDSECMLFVYALLFFIHVLMSNDRAGETFGLIFAEPVAASMGYYRPVSTIRYVEWSIASPMLMSLIGRSIPRVNDKDKGGRELSDTLRPALVGTVSYIFLAWLALVVVDPFWRWTLIFFSFGGYIVSTADQLTSWRTDADNKASCAVASYMMLEVQIFVYGAYGVVYLLPLWDILDSISEQAALTYADATVKLTCSACLAAMRHAESLAEARRERNNADSIAADLRQIIHDANAPIFALDADGNVSLWNQKLARLTGATIADVVGKPLVNYLSKECRDEFREIFEARKGGKQGTEQFHCDMIARHDRRRSEDEDNEHNEERLISMLMTATARHDAEGHFIGIVGVGSDLTEVTRIKAVEEKKNQFMAVVSHELKSPLHGIIGLAGNLSQSEKNDERKRQLKMVKNCAVRLLDLVSNIMQMSRLTKDRDALEDNSEKDAMENIRRDPMDIASIIDEVCMLITNATDKGSRPILNPLVKFENKLQSVSSSAGQANKGAHLPIVEGDAYKITQVFYNILTNACKFCTHGSIIIDAGVNGAMDRLEVTVTDTGIGINPENVKRIFEPFEQESNSSIRSFGGIGLGLAISKQVIELHGGDVSVSSTPGKGSKFVVSFPVTEEAVALAMVPPSEVDHSQEPATISMISRTGSAGSVARAQLRESDLSKPPLSGRNSDEEKTVILSVDDDIVNQEVIRSALSDQYELHVAMNGFEALDFFSTRSKLPDLVLLDVMMPGMDGFEVLNEIREQKKISPTTLPVIMLSAMEPVDKALIQSLKSGANDYVPKPFDPDILKARVSTAVEVKRLRQIENESFHYSRLLHDILPIHIVERLILGDNNISERHESVCMLFTDIVGWTPMSESVPTHQLIDLLNQLFSEFDVLTEKHGVYKADTIGDAYIVAAGHEGQAGPSDATLRVVEFAIDMLEKVKEAKPPNGMQLQMRVGIHTGPAYSGVVGKKVPKYTFFGDTVNTAARMEQTGVPGCINMSSVARQALASEVAACRSGRSLEGWLAPLGASILRRDPIMVKGKGAMDLSILCPKGVSSTIARRLSKMQKRSSFRDSFNASEKSMSSMDSGHLEASDDARLKDEVITLRKDLDRLEASEREAWAEVESLRLNLHRAEPNTFMLQGDRMNRESSNAKQSFTSLSSPSPPPDAPVHIQQLEELKLQLLVTTNSLTRARRAILDKDSEIDEMELQVQRVKRQRQTKTRRGMQGSLDLTDTISFSTGTHRSSFMARTQELLETSSTPLALHRERQSAALPSIGSLGIQEEGDDLVDDDFDEGEIAQLKQLMKPEIFQRIYTPMNLKRKHT